MRARRSKRYRRLMAQYRLAPFNFHEPYQVLLDATFLRACHRFHMPLQKFVENTLHGKCRLFITRCTLAKVMKEFEHEGMNQAGSNGGMMGSGKKLYPRRPDFLPPPTEVPLRYCKHGSSNSEEEGEKGEGTVVSEEECLVDLCSGQARGNEVPKNKQHFVLATADMEDAVPAEKSHTGKGKDLGARKKSQHDHIDVRELVRRIPGVPIIYVKRSVMVLEELSAASEAARRGEERSKLREGLLVKGLKRKRKRDDEDGDEEEGEKVLGTGVSLSNAGTGTGAPATKRRLKRAKGANPLSVLKKKPKPQQRQSNEHGDGDGDGSGEEMGRTGRWATEMTMRGEGDGGMPKAKRKRKHGRRKSDLADGQSGEEEHQRANGVPEFASIVQAAPA